MKKKLILAVFCLIISAMTFAQVPQKMSYQAVVRGSDNNLVINSDVSVRVSILQGSVDGEAVYTETHSATTNANGLLTIEIGNGTSSDDFSAISWANGPFFVKTETDLNGGEACCTEAIDEGEALTDRPLCIGLRVVNVCWDTAHNVAPFPVEANDGTYFTTETAENTFFENCHNLKILELIKRLIVLSFRRGTSAEAW